jgi:hypothetical protein
MMLDGTLCEGCGVHMEGDGYGVPRRCDACSDPDALITLLKCNHCSKQFTTATGREQHCQAKHKRRYL